MMMMMMKGWTKKWRGRNLFCHGRRSREWGCRWHRGLEDKEGKEFDVEREKGKKKICQLSEFFLCEICLCGLRLFFFPVILLFFFVVFFFLLSFARTCEKSGVCGMNRMKQKLDKDIFNDAHVCACGWVGVHVRAHELCEKGKRFPKETRERGKETVCGICNTHTQPPHCRETMPVKKS